MNFSSYVLLCGCNGVDLPPPLNYDRDLPRLDRSHAHGEIPGTLLYVSSQEGGGRGKRET